MLSAFVFLLLFQAIGETLSHYFSLPIPGSVIGLILLVIYLQLVNVSPKELKPVSQLFVQNLALLFLPTAVGIFFLEERLSSQWPALLAVSVGSTFFAMLVCIAILHRKRKSGDPEFD